MTVEKAFEFLGYGRPWVIRRKSRKSYNFTDEDTQDMVRMRETMTYQEIADVYGCDKHTIFATATLSGSYAAIVTKAVKDLSGNKLAAVNVFNFATV